MSSLSALLKAEIVSCNHDWTLKSPIIEGINPPYNVTPFFTHTGTFGMFPDGLSAASVSMQFSGQHGAPTVDALGHVGVDQTLFDGTPLAESQDSQGLLTKHGIDEFPEEKYVNRGVLVDLPHCMKLDKLPANTTASLAQVEDCLEQEKVEIEAGDSVLFRTGYGALFSTDPMAYITNYPGMGREVAQHLADQDIFLTGADNIGWDVLPSDFPGHNILVGQNGIYIAENINLELLSKACQERGTWEFALVVNPPKIKGAAAMATNIFAIFPAQAENDAVDYDSLCTKSSGGTMHMNHVFLMPMALVGVLWALF